MIVAAHHTMLAPPALPYDAQVEYIESTGTQYVDTGFTAKTDTTRAEMLIVPTGNTTAGVFGSRNATTANGYSCNAFLISGSTPYFRWDWVAGSSGTRTNCTIGDEYRISITAGSVTVNGVTTTASLYRLQQSYPFYIFTFANASTTPFTPTFSGRVKWFQIYDNDVLVRSFVPVRVGTVGYLFDRVSGQLFGNAGTGAFVIGPDK